MKKKYLIIFVIGCLFLTGCVSDSDYNTLEERVSRLEELVGVSDSNHEETSINESQSVKDATSSESAENESPAGNTEHYTYFIDSISDSAVVDEYMYYYNNIPKQGDTYEQVISMLKEEPLREDNLSFSYCDSMEVLPEKDVITNIGYSGIFLRTEMDGTVDIQNPDNYEPYGIYMNLIILDYDRAVSLFDEFYNTLGSKLENTSKSQEGSTWVAKHQVTLTGDDHTASSYWDEDFIKMERKENYYSIYISVRYY